METFLIKTYLFHPNVETLFKSTLLAESASYKIYLTITIKRAFEVLEWKASLDEHLITHFVYIDFSP